MARETWYWREKWLCLHDITNGYDFIRLPVQVMAAERSPLLVAPEPKSDFQRMPSVASEPPVEPSSLYRILPRYTDYYMHQSQGDFNIVKKGAHKRLYYVDYFHSIVNLRLWKLLLIVVGLCAYVPNESE